MPDFNDALGIDYLLPSAAYSNDQFAGAGSGAPAAASGPGASPVVSNGAVPAVDGALGGQGLGALQPQPQGGFSAPRFMASLGAGLSSAGQNWNKPAAAAFAGGAGAALQGGQSYDNQLQSLKLKALQAAIAAYKVGDMSAYRQATLNLRALTAQPRRPAAPAPAAPTSPASAPANNPPAAPAAPTPPASAPPNNPPAAPAGAAGNGSGPTTSGSPAPAAATPAPSGGSAARPSAADVIAQAHDAIARGAPPDAVRQRAAQYGVDLSLA